MSEKVEETAIKNHCEMESCQTNTANSGEKKQEEDICRDVLANGKMNRKRKSIAQQTESSVDGRPTWSSPDMKVSKVGNQTNSQDPQAVNSRAFVGNLNTFQCSKTDVERMFQRYGRIAGISMHKGYAFVQFTNPFDARSACLGEDGRTVLGQTLDVNMVAEPKPHQTGRKRQNMAKTGNDWDYYYDSYYASAAFPPGPPPRLVPPLKRPRLMVGPPLSAAAPAAPRPLPSLSASAKLTASALAAAAAAAAAANSVGQQQKGTAVSAPIHQLKSYSNPDILICGNCREMFTELQELLDHKKTYCKLRFTCKCHAINGTKNKGAADHINETGTALLCMMCKDSFSSAWDLMVHVQAAHMLNIYELGVPKRRSESGETGDEEEASKDVTKRNGTRTEIKEDFDFECGTPSTPMEAGSPVVGVVEDEEEEEEEAVAASSGRGEEGTVANDQVALVDAKNNTTTIVEASQDNILRMVSPTLTNHTAAAAASTESSVNEESPGVGVPNGVEQ